MTPESRQARVAVLLAALGHGEGCTYTVERRTRGEGSRRWPWRVAYRASVGETVEQPLWGGDRCYATESEAHTEAVAWLERRVRELAAERRSSAELARAAVAYTLARADELERSAAVLEAVL